jgi:hypothetical protein
VPLARTAVAKRAFGIAAPNLWNSLPQELRGIESPHAFKTKLKTFLFTKYFSILFVSSTPFYNGLCLVFTSA